MHILFPFISAELLHSQIPKVWSCTSVRKWFTLALRKCWPAVLYLLWDLTAAKRQVKWRGFPELHVSHSKVILTAIQPLLYQITVLSFLFPLGTKIPCEALSHSSITFMQVPWPSDTCHPLLFIQSCFLKTQVVG